MTALASGARLGPYQILEPIGAGGMGEVYKASDMRLDRVVAIKVLPRHWTANDEMKQRFVREAQTLASLNHPNICVLHDIGSQDGVDFLVMEHLEGETLAARLERGPIPLSEALRLGLEIVDALDKAHRKGIVHRDLKPSNVMLTKSGTKLLDFGLAKFATQPSSTSLSNTPTAMPTLPSGKDLTTPGTILGTLQYMAPEQLEGLEVDGRTDIFAFGALLHEMVTGRKAFEGKNRVLLIAAIATSDPPPLSSVEPAASKALDHVVKTCLAKEPADRWQTSRDLLEELEFVAEGGAENSAATPAGASARQIWLRRVLLSTAGILAGALVASAARYLHGPSTPDELRFRVPIQLTADTRAAGGTGGNYAANAGFQGVSGIGVFNPANFAISPDGRELVFAARQTNQGDTWYLYVRPVGGVTPKQLQGTESAEFPFWSADSRSIAFVSGGELKRVERDGGPPQRICDAANFQGGTWNKDGIILFGSAQGLQRVPAQGGKHETVTHPADSESGHFWPHFLPDGRHFLYTAWAGKAESRAIVAGALDAPDRRTQVLPLGSNAGYSDPGYLVFHRESAVYAQAFDPGKLQVSGDLVRIADEITFDSGSGRGDFSVSRAGALAYFYNSNTTGAAAGQQSDSSDWQLSWVSPSGQLLQAVGPPGVYRGIDVSPDTKRVAVHRHDANGGDIVVLEARGSDLRLTLDASQHNSSPIWSPDGSQIVFSSLRNGKWGLYQTLSTRSGSQTPLYESDVPVAPMSWSPDNKRIVFWSQDPSNGGDIWVLTLDDKKAAPLIATPYNETHPQISPDGKWIAYTDNSKDGRNEIYVRPFPTGTDIYQISFNGGDWPRWRFDSKELFYHAIGAGQNPSISAGFTAFNGILFSAKINFKGAVLENDAPHEIVAFPVINVPHSGGSYFPYAIDPKGDRFLVMQLAPPITASINAQISADTFSGLTVALNWTSTLRK